MTAQYYALRIVSFCTVVGVVVVVVVVVAAVDKYNAQA